MTKERPILFNAAMVNALLGDAKTQTRRVGLFPDADRVEHFEGLRWDSFRADGKRLDTKNCPYGQPGDRLWVRETHTHQPSVNDWETVAQDKLQELVKYRADCKSCCDDAVWRPSIFMHRWASRITLEVTDVRVERLQDISVEDALAEGIDHKTMNCPRHEYFQLWNSINGELAHESNPWVWVVTFKRLENEA